MTYNETEQPVSTEAALHAHEIAYREYSELKERVTTLHERMTKHKRTADVALSEANERADYWRKALRSTDGEINKEIRKARTESSDAKEMAEEFQLLANEVAIEYEIARIDLHELRDKYLAARKAARSAYGQQCREIAATELLNTAQAASFFGELARSGHLLSYKELIENDKAAASLGREIARLIPKLDAPVNDTWAALSLEPEDPAETLDKSLVDSRLARVKMRESLVSRQKS